MDDKLRSIWDAACENDVQLMETLLDDAPELISARDGNQWTPLHHAAVCSSLNVMAILLARGADVHAQGRANETPLHLADNEPVTWLLLRYGADPLIVDRYGMTALDLVNDDKQPELHQMILDAMEHLYSRSRVPPLN